MKIKLFVTIFSAFFVISGCSKSGTESTPVNPAVLPVLSAISSAHTITSTSATVNASVVSDGGKPVTARGICWSTSPGPTTSNLRTVEGTGLGSFSSMLTGLNTGVTYYARAYATNGNGTSYSTEISFVTNNTDVYVAGYLQTDSIRFPVATIWKNGSPISLTNGAYAAVANSVFVSGNDVYAAGTDKAAGTYPIAKYWKNGVGYTLTNGTSLADAKSVCVVGSDVYVAGYEGNNFVTVAKVWKNGILTALTNGTTN